MRLKNFRESFRDLNAKTYFCNFTALHNRQKKSINIGLKVKKNMIFFFFFNTNFANKAIFFSVKILPFCRGIAKQIIKLDYLIKALSSGVPINFFYKIFNDFFFFILNANFNFFKYFSAKNGPRADFSFRNHSSCKTARLSNFCIVAERSPKLAPEKTKISLVRLGIFFGKYFFFSKSFRSILLKTFKNNLVNFILNSKKRVGAYSYQSVQDSAGYTNNFFMQLNGFFFKLKNRPVGKLISYTTSRNRYLFSRTSNQNINSFNITKIQYKSFFLEKKFVNINQFCAVFNFFFKPIFFKYLYVFFKNSLKFLISPNSFFNMIPRHFLFFKEKFLNSNIFPAEKFSFFIKKHFLYIANFNKFNYTLMFSFQITLIKFIQVCSGKDVFFKIYPYLYNVLNTEEQIRCALWSQKIKYYRKVLGPKLFLNESLQIIYLSLKYKDIHLFSNWTTAMFYKISFWKHKMFLRYLKYVFRYFFLGIYRKLEFKGIKFQLKGKISVAGNSRTRTSFHYVGFTSHSTFNNKILHKLNLVRTFTGVLGFKIWFVF